MSHAKESYLLYGPPGSGKTTIADQVRQFTDLEYFSFGHLVRKEIQKGSDVVRHFKAYAAKDRVAFPPMDPEVVDLVERNVEDLLHGGQGILFDGFPKHIGEIPAFQRIVEKFDLSFGGTILVEVPYDELLKRVELRRICSSCQAQTALTDRTEIRDCSCCGGSLEIRKEDHPERFAAKYSFYTQVLEGTLAALDEMNIPFIRIDGSVDRAQVAEKVDVLFNPVRRLRESI